MTPLSDALTAAQRRALTALEKAYVAGAIEGEKLREGLHACGISDDVDISYLTHALDLLREWGAPVPAEPNGKPDANLASDKQKGLIRNLCARKNVAEPEDFDYLTKEQASEAIDALDKGTYDPGKWKLPF